MGTNSRLRDMEASQLCAESKLNVRPLGYVVWKGRPIARSWWWATFKWCWHVTYVIVLVMLLSIDIMNSHHGGHNISNVFEVLKTCLLKMFVIVNTILIIFLIFYDPGRVKSPDPSEMTLDWRWCPNCHLVVPPDADHCNICNCCMLGRYLHISSSWICVTRRTVKFHVLIKIILAGSLLIMFSYPSPQYSTMHENRY